MQATRYKKPDAIRELEDAVFDVKKQKHPNVPYLTKHQYSDKTANDLTRAIIDFVRLRGGQAERINTTGRAKRRKSIKRISRQQEAFITLPVTLHRL